MKDSKRLDCRSAIVICLLIAFPLAYYAQFQSDEWKAKLSNWGDNLGIRKVHKGEDAKEPLELLLRRFIKGQDHIQPDAVKFACYADAHSDICVASEQVKIDTRTLTIYLSSNSTSLENELNVQPYARKEDETAMKRVSPVQIRHGNITAPACQYFHDAPAVLFSSGGFTGNLFHEFNEVIIPLFITCSHFRSHLRFVVSDFKSWFIRKYDHILSNLSNYEVIDATANGSVHCFPGAVIGLKYHDNLAVNISDIPGRYSMHDFKQFLRQSFHLKYKDISVIKKPKLILISRRKTRIFLNEDEMVKMMEDLGFQVIIALASNLSNLDKFSEVVNSCSVMIGAHGAGLTNELFLPAGAVVVQIVPLGLDWPANAYFGAPAKEMDLQYLEYKIKPKESSLYDLYGPDHPVIADPASIFAKGYRASRAVYVDGQNMTIHIGRFRETLVEAMRLLGRSNAR